MASLYSAVTVQGTSPDYRNDFLTENFIPIMQSESILPHIFNAMATVLGTSATHTWRLWEVVRETDIPSQASGINSDGLRRYFFEYTADNDSVQSRFFFEYSRLDNFELRGTKFNASGPTDVVLEQNMTKQAIVAMLLAILYHENSDDIYMASARCFKNDYKEAFVRGIDQCRITISNIFDILKKVTNPALQASEDNYFNVDANFMRGPSLVRVLENETIGYVDQSTGEVHIAAGMAAKLLLHSEHPMPGHIIDDLFIELPSILPPPGTGRDNKITKGMYMLNPARVFDEEEMHRLLEVPTWYIPPEDICEMAYLTHESQRYLSPFRNLLLRGPSGGGKTEGAKVLSCMFGLPYGVVTCHSESEIFDLTSNLIPRTDEEITTPEQMAEYLKHALENYQLDFPSFSEMAAMPDIAYHHITGKRKDNATEQDCMAAMVTKMLSVVKSERKLYMGEKSKFKVVRSDFAEGMQKGWLVELQECNIIEKPGVLVGLNNIMENGFLKMPTGEIIHRHPDTMVVFTQNVGYAGTTDVNQSVLSRVNLKCDLEHPSEDEMCERIQQHVPDLSMNMIRLLVQAGELIRDTCAEEIERGVVGTRELIYWAQSTAILGDVRRAAKLTILPSCTDDKDDREKIFTAAIKNLC